MNSLDWNSYLQRLAKALPPELVHGTQIDDFVPENHEKAILFYHGAWSGPSVAAIKAIFACIGRVPDPPALFVLNADDFTSATTEPQWRKLKLWFGGVLHADGETAWIVNHRIVARDVVSGPSGGGTVLVERRIRDYFSSDEE